MSNKAEAALKQIFLESSDSVSGLLTADQFSSLVFDCTGKIVDVQNIIKLFEKRKLQNSLGMNESEFLEFYACSALKDPSKVRKDLEVFGFDAKSLIRHVNNERLTFDKENGLTTQLKQRALSTGSPQREESSIVPCFTNVRSSFRFSNNLIIF